MEQETANIIAYVLSGLTLILIGFIIGVEWRDWMNDKAKERQRINEEIISKWK